MRHSKGEKEIERESITWEMCAVWGLRPKARTVRRARLPRSPTVVATAVTADFVSFRRALPLPLPHYARRSRGAVSSSCTS